MSHFTVLVIGDNPEIQLEPYDENIEVAPYLDTDFDLEKSLQGVRSWLLKPESDTPANARLRKLASIAPEELTNDQKLALVDEWDGGDLRIEEVDGVETVVRYSSYNPLSKWDWYTLGGRWNGFFQLKPGATGVPVQGHWSEPVDEDGKRPDKTGLTDQARKGDIDWGAMRKVAEVEALQKFQGVEERTKGITPPAMSRSDYIDAAMADLDPEDEQYQEARAAAIKEYMQHPWVQAAANGDSWAAFEDVYETYCVGHADPKTEFLERAVENSVSTFAMLCDGEWSERGEMGWFGAHTDKVSKKDFARSQWALIQSLPDDTLISLYDLHI